MDKERFVIVCLLKGETLNFHENLTNNIKLKFNVNPQKLPAHFTIKAPFETEDPNNIIELETLIKDFCENHSKNEMSINGFNHFNDRVIYMNIEASLDAIKTTDDFTKELKKLSWLEWKKNEFKKKVFHCTVATKFSSYKFNELWNFVNNYNPSFHLYFDNISILKWENYRWKTYKEFNFKE